MKPKFFVVIHDKTLGHAVAIVQNVMSELGYVRRILDGWLNQQGIYGENRGNYYAISIAESVFESTRNSSPSRKKS